MRLLEITAQRETSGHLLEPEATRPVEYIKLQLIDAEIFFDRDGTAKLMVRKKFFGTYLFNNSGGSTGYWQATDEEIDLLRKGGYELPDWRRLMVADIGQLYPNW